MVELLTALLLTQTPGPPSCVTADSRVEALIEAKRQELRGTEYCQSRMYETLSDFDGDRRDDFLVVFGIEGAEGNMGAVVQFVAVFASGSQWRPVVTEVGRRGQRVIQSIVPGPGTAIRLAALEYGPRCVSTIVRQPLLAFTDSSRGPRPARAA